jgi:hypothetical protein
MIEERRYTGGKNQPPAAEASSSNATSIQTFGLQVNWRSGQSLAHVAKQQAETIGPPSQVFFEVPRWEKVLVTLSLPSSSDQRKVYHLLQVLLSFDSHVLNERTDLHIINIWCPTP